LSTLLLVCFLHTASVLADDIDAPWKRHMIDDSSRGADGTRLGDADGDGLIDTKTDLIDAEHCHHSQRAGRDSRDQSPQWRFDTIAGGQRAADRRTCSQQLWDRRESAKWVPMKTSATELAYLAKRKPLPALDEESKSTLPRRGGSPPVASPN
jgi:hypothetical protein